MIRGKATELMGLGRLRHTLPVRERDARKSNPNVRRGSPDEDIRITHRRTGTVLAADAGKPSAAASGWRQDALPPPTSWRETPPLARDH